MPEGIQAVVLVITGIVAGVAGTAGAIASLISYPALLAVGVPARAANITNSIAVVAAGLTSTAASRPELRGAGQRLAGWAVVTACGASVGCALLLATSGAVFAWLVPFLVATGALALLLQPRIAQRRGTRVSTRAAPWLPAGLFVVAVYNGYFGAGSGVMTLAVLLLAVEARLPRANALKNALLAIADVIAAIGFVVFGPVHWAAAVPLAIGFLAGGAIGPVIARRARADILRVSIATAGFLLAAWLLVNAMV